MLKNVATANTASTTTTVYRLHSPNKIFNKFSVPMKPIPVDEKTGDLIDNHTNTAAARAPPLHADPNFQYYLYYYTYYPTTLTCQRRIHNLAAEQQENSPQPICSPSSPVKHQQPNQSTQALLYEKLQLAHNRSKLSNELMTHYHLQVSEKDYRSLLTGAVPRPYDIDPLFDSFDYLPRNLPKERIPEACLAVINDLNLIERWRLKRPTLARFFCLVVRGYRDVPYHNVRHAFSVYHFAYLLSKRLRLSDYLDDLAVFAFLISAVCHDLDHRGTTNAFQVASQSVLAALYSSEGSVMERHHLAQSMCIINTEGCNIFESLSSREYGQMLDYMRDMILATDLAHHLNILPEIRQMISDGYRRDNERHRYLLTCMLMTASDLSDQSKPWQCSVEIAQLVYKEFFSQGDLEKAMGRLPCEMMDRDKAFIPQLQIQFIGEIVLPVFEQVERLFGKPKTGQLRKAAQRNVECWQQVEDRYRARRTYRSSNSAAAGGADDNSDAMLTSADIFDDRELFDFEPAMTDHRYGLTGGNSLSPSAGLDGKSPSNNDATPSSVTDRRRFRRRPPSRGDNSTTNNDYQLQFAAVVPKTTSADNNNSDAGGLSVAPSSSAMNLSSSSPSAARETSFSPRIYNGNEICSSSSHHQSSAALHDPLAATAADYAVNDSRKSHISSVSNKRRSSSTHTVAFYASDASNSRNNSKQHEVLFYTHPQGRKPEAEKTSSSNAAGKANGSSSRAPLAAAESSSSLFLLPTSERPAAALAAANRAAKAAEEAAESHHRHINPSRVRKLDNPLAFSSSSTSTSSSAFSSSNDHDKSMSPTPPSASALPVLVAPLPAGGGSRSVTVSPMKSPSLSSSSSKAANKAMKK